MSRVIEMAWHMAGVVGVDPRQYTFGELQAMYVARELVEWSRLAQLLSVVIGVATGKRVPPQKLLPKHLARRVQEPAGPPLKAMDVARIVLGQSDGE